MAHRNMFGRASTIALGALIACVAGTAAAQSNWKPAWDALMATPDAPWKAEWTKLVAAAKKEGSLVLIIPPSSTHREFLAKEWPKTFPDIELSLSVVQGGELLPRLKLERDSGKYVWDLALTGSDNGFQMRDAGMLDPVRPELLFPDVKDPKTWGGWGEAFMDKGSEYVLAARSFLKMPFYNAAHLPPEKVKRLGTKVFLDPSLKEKIIWHDPAFGGSGRTFAGVMMRLLGEDGLRGFVTEQVVFTPKMMDLVERMARSQYAVALGPVLTRLLARYKKAGVEFDIRPLGNTPELGAYGNSGGSNMVVVKNRPHPNATRVFINWYLSKPVAAAMAKTMGEDSRRVDIPEQVEPAQRRVPGVKYFEAQREENTPVTDRAQELIAQFRGKS
jgi:iron(III) transport system substrate-binding protein